MNPVKNLTQSPPQASLSGMNPLEDFRMAFESL